MIESVARLRGDQLTLGYGKFTVAEKPQCVDSRRSLHRNYRAKRLRKINATAHAESSDDARAR
ncbi:ferric enterobactin transport ATP-binding protein [Citrobacter freundii]|nr:ferric enterobactin transport ATP-binding protein [Citrobacter freundii]